MKQIKYYHQLDGSHRYSVVGLTLDEIEKLKEQLNNIYNIVDISNVSLFFNKPSGYIICKF